MPVVHRRRLLSVIAASLPLLAAASASAAAPPRPFGARGQVAIEDLVGVRSTGVGFLNILSPASGSYGPVGPPAFSGLVSYGSSEIRTPMDSSELVSTGKAISVAPSLDVFVANRISLGLTAGFGYGWGHLQLPLVGASQIEGGTSYTVGVAPRVGYVIPLEGGLSLWPRIGVGFTFSRADSSEMISGEPTRDTSKSAGFRWVVGTDLGVVFRPARHFFFNATPEVSVAHGANGAQAPGATSTGQNTLVRFAGTLSLGVLLDS